MESAEIVGEAEKLGTAAISHIVVNTEQAFEVGKEGSQAAIWGAAF